MLRPAYEQQCARGEATGDACRSVLPWAPSGDDGQAGAVGDSDAITITVSAGFGEQLNHAYTLAVPDTVFVARVAPGSYNRELSRPLCMPLYFSKGDHRTLPACEKAAQDRLAGARRPREERLALLEAYAVADDQDHRNIGLVHLRTAELRGFAADVAVPRSSALGKPLPLRSYTRQPCPECIEQHPDGRRYFDVRRHCEARHLPKDREVNETHRSYVQLCAHQIMRDEFAPAPVDGPPSVALPGTPVLDAAGPGVVVETDEFGAYWEGVDEVIREASVARMEAIVEKAERLGDEVGGSSGTCSCRGGPRLFRSGGTRSRPIRSANSHLPSNRCARTSRPARGSAGTQSEGVVGSEERVADTRVEHCQARGLDSEHQGLTRRQSDLAALRSTLKQKAKAAQDGGMSSEPREGLEPIRTGLAAIADDVGLEVDDLGSDTWSDLQTTAEDIADALVARLDGILARKDKLREPAPTVMDFAEPRLVGTQHKVS